MTPLNKDAWRIFVSLTLKVDIQSPWDRKYVYRGESYRIDVARLDYVDYRIALGRFQFGVYSADPAISFWVQIKTGQVYPFEVQYERAMVSKAFVSFKSDEPIAINKDEQSGFAAFANEWLVDINTIINDGVSND